MRMRYPVGLRGTADSFRFLRIFTVSTILIGGFLIAGLGDSRLGKKEALPVSADKREFSSSDIYSGPSSAPPVPSVRNVDQSASDNPVEISDMTGDGDTLLSLFSLSFCDTKHVEQVAESLASAIKADLGKPFLATDELPPGKRFVIYLDGKSEFRKATIEWDPSRIFHCEKENGSIRSWREDVVLDYKTEVCSFKVQRDIVQSILASSEERELAVKLIHIFRWDIDFQADVRSGDECKIVFERRYADDRPAGYGHILYAEYYGKRTGKRTACLFNGEYFDGNGVELKKDYLRAPLNTLRITSGYGMRIHPVLHIWKMHTGVDYGAPIGTPVYAIANGTVRFQGCGPAYGLFICVRHDNGFESRYSHLSRILVRNGQRVKQRQTIGLVGSTGRSTGPHLFFEIIASGKRINPTKVKLVKTPRNVPDPLKQRFATVMNDQTRFLHPGYSIALQ